MTKITVSNQKGGVGKTTTTLNLGAALVRRGFTVQLWDLNEVQGNLSSYAPRCGIPCRQTAGTNLRQDLNSIEVDFHILDCSPRAESTVYFAYELSDMVIVPVQCEQFSVDGTVDLLATLAPIKAAKPSLDIRALISMYSAPFKDEKNELKKVDAVRFFNAVVPRLAAFPKAQGQGVSIFDYEGGERGARVFESLAKEVLK